MRRDHEENTHMNDVNTNVLRIIVTNNRYTLN
jgi:hypothetical protein